MLYSLNGQYPTEIPFRIVLSDGRTRTDPSTFTEQEIADAGYVVVPEPPTKGPYQRLLWDGTVWSLEETRTLEEAILIKLNELSTLRKSKELDFTFNGVKLVLNEQTQARINGAVTGFAYRPNDIISWEVSRGIFVDFNKVAMEALGTAAWEHIRECYVIVKSITQKVKACTSLAEVDLINLETEWQNGSIT